MLLRVSLPFLLIGAVCATYGGSGQYAEYDCGGSCGGGCGQSGAYSNPCGGQSAPVVQYESVSSGCGDDCGGSYGGGAATSSRYSSGRSSSSGYHKSSTTITKETRNDHLKIIVGQPQVQVRRTTYVKPAPIVQQPVYQAPVYQAPVAYKQRYVDQGSSYGGGESNYDCSGPCGGSKIVKIIKKTTYSSGGGGDVCNTCGGESEGYSSNVEYSQPIVTHRKVTRIVTQPVVTRVIKKTIVTPVESSSYYEDTGSSYGGGGHGGKRYSSGGSGGGRAKAGAFAYASASAGAGAGSSSGDYVGGGGSGCKSGCEEWKK